jgi:hypothetical protein
MSDFIDFVAFLYRRFEPYMSPPTKIALLLVTVLLFVLVCVTISAVFFNT